jgi:hypothetical protein
MSQPPTSLCSLGDIGVIRRFPAAGGKLGALARHVALDVGECSLELRLVAEGDEPGVEVALVAPAVAPSRLLRCAQCGKDFVFSAAQCLNFHMNNPIHPGIAVCSGPGRLRSSFNSALSGWSLSGNKARDSA